VTQWHFLINSFAEEKTFGFIFVDHWHGYEATHSAVIRATRLLLPGGFVMFHDYNDPSATLPDHPDKVFQAVTDAVGGDSRFQFCCVVASGGVWRYKQ
jgi:predicted O-methyltransferase YrrM